MPIWLLLIFITHISITPPVKYVLLIGICVLTQNLFAQTADFSFDAPPASFCVPATVQFKQISSAGADGYVWDFGDGSNSYGLNPAHTYTAAGSFQVKLLVIFPRSTVRVTKTVTIHPSNSVALATDRNFICTGGDISFIAKAVGEQHYAWDFGDGTQEISAESRRTHAFTNFQDYKISLVATDKLGCEASASTLVSLKSLQISASFSSSARCAPAATQFKASATVPARSTIASYQWDFGDNASVSNASGSIRHVYTARGSYQPKVKIITSEGCEADYTFPVAAFGVPPSDLTAFPKKETICASELAEMTASAPGANQYVWQFGDGSSSPGSATRVTHKYNALGVQTVTVTAYDNGCAGSIATFPIEVTGVLSRFDYASSCSRREEVSFTNESIGNVTSSLWDFGDGGQSGQASSLIHTFPASGAYNATLTVTDALTGCSDVSQAAIYTASPTLRNADTTICRNSVTRFDVDNSYNNPSTLYIYHIAGTVTDPVPTNFMTITAAKAGVFSDFVVIDNGPKYCKDTAYLAHQIKVRGPVLDFSIDPLACVNDSLKITNLSHPFSIADTLQKLTWAISSGDTIDGFAPQRVKFASAGMQRVKLSAVDNHGCADTLVKPVVINPLPFLRVISEADTLCAGDAATLTAFHNSSLAWSSPQPIACDDCDTLTISPGANTYYVATATSAAGCHSSDTIKLKVYEPFSAVAVNAAPSICPGDTVSLRLLPAELSVIWAPTAGLSVTSGYDPVASPKESTEYVATLTDAAGCFTSDAHFTVHVYDAAVVDAGADTTVGYNTPFQLRPGYSSNISKYEWTPSGDLNCVFCAAPEGTALDNYQYSIRVVSADGCVARDSVKVFIACNEANLLLPNAFTPNNDNLNDVFYPIGRGISLIRRFAIYDRWGRMVFSQSNFKPNDRRYGWDGRIRGEPLQTGLFAYVIEAVCGQGQDIHKKGTVKLIK